MGLGRALATLVVMTILGVALGLSVGGAFSPEDQGTGDASGSPQGLAAASPRPSPRATVSPSTRPNLAPEPQPTPQPTASATARVTPWPSIDPLFLPDPTDPDADGLPAAREEQLGTDPSRWDTDGGGEKDSHEVDAGRDPLDKRDDRPAGSCPPPRTDPLEPFSSPLPVPELEALLPDRIGGWKVAKTSTRGLPQMYGFFNFFWHGLLACAGGEPQDLSHAMAHHRRLDGFYVFAIRVDGISGRELERRLVGELVENGPLFELPVSLGDRRYIVVWAQDQPATAWYSSGDVAYMLATMGATDSGLWLSGALQFDLIEEVVRALPAPTGRRHR